MNAVAQKSGNSETKSKPGKSNRPKQAASAGGTPEKQTAKRKKPVTEDSNSTGKKPAGKKKTTRKKKTAGRKKTTSKRKSTTRRSGAAGEKPAAANGTAGRASVPIDPPPVILPDAAAAADDPKSLSWMAQQAVSALNAVKAHQAEKGKAIMARAEKDKPERGHTDSNRPTGKPAHTTGADEPGDAGQLQIEDIAETAAGSSGKENRADTGTQQGARKQPGAPQQTGTPAPAGIAASPEPPPAEVPAPGERVVADRPPPLRATAKRRYPTRLQVLIVIAIAVPLWLYFGAGDEAVEVITTQPEQELAGIPALEAAGQSAAVAPDKPAWQPASAPAQFREPVPVSQEPESTQSTDTAVPVAASELTGMPAEDIGQPVVETPETPARETGPEPTDSAPLQPVTPPGRRAPGYGYYPPQRSWQPPAYYRPGYSRPPSR